MRAPTGLTNSFLYRRRVVQWPRLKHMPHRGPAVLADEHCGGLERPRQFCTKKQTGGCTRARCRRISGQPLVAVISPVWRPCLPEQAYGSRALGFRRGPEKPRQSRSDVTPNTSLTVLTLLLFCGLSFPWGLPPPRTPPAALSRPKMQLAPVFLGPIAPQGWFGGAAAPPKEAQKS